MKKRYRIVRKTKTYAGDRTIENGYAPQWSVFGWRWKPVLNFWKTEMVYPKESMAKACIEYMRERNTSKLGTYDYPGTDQAKKEGLI